ncbi:MAG TPA: glycosyltransferase family 4 protein [Candidatus Eisenbacteria bacterium]|nr:glycosyltransferase family 4 protein [Candidatus Eisenbacteria bacterium]
MRIALCHKRLDLRGGAERNLYVTAASLRDLGHEVHLFCGAFAVDAPAGTFAHRVPTAALGRAARLWSFALAAPKIIARYDCDIVVNFGRMLRQDVLRSGGGTHRAFLEKLAREGGFGRRLWQSASVYHRSVLALERRQYSPGHFKRVIAVSGIVKQEIAATYNVPEEKITVLHNGVDCDRFNLSLRQRWRDWVRRQWGIPPAAPVVLFVGSGFRRKGLDRLLKVWERPGLEDAYLLIVGRDRLLPAYAARVRKARGRVIFAGAQEQVERFYGAADTVALPSLQEAFGNVVLEALASGLPIVVSRSVGGAEVLAGGFADGIIENPDESVELERKIKIMLDRSRRPETALAARRIAESHSWKNQVKKLEACLLELKRSNGAPVV